MPEYKLTYFNVKGLGECVRYMLSYMGKNFEDVRFEDNEWPTIKPKILFGRVPMLEIDGKAYGESTAICRYLAIEAGLSGKTPIENLQIDQMAGAIMDLWSEATKLWKLENEGNMEAAKTFKQTLMNDTIPYYFSKFELILRDNGYIANGKLSWADILLVSYGEHLFPFLQITDYAEKYPYSKALSDKVQSLPGIKEWIERRPFTAY